MSALIDLFPPHDDEFVIGYLRRLAERNRIDSWQSLVRMAEVTPSRQGVWLYRARLSEYLGLKSKWLDQVMPEKEDGVGLHAPSFLRRRMDAVCPECLKEQGYIRRAWSHTYVLACPAHRVRLLDQCPNCQSPLRAERSSIQRCDCGFELGQAKAEPASAFEIWVSARLRRDMTDVPGLPTLETEQECDGLANLLMLLSSRADPANKIRTSKVAQPRSLEEARRYLAPVEAILGNWPQGMREHVAMRVRAGPQIQSTLVGRLGAWYRSMARHCENGRYESIWTAVSDAIADSFDGKMRGAGSLRFSTGYQRAYMSLHEASQRLGVSRLSLKMAVDKGSLQARVDKASELYTNIQITWDQVEFVKASRERWVSEEVACKLLDVPPSVLRMFVLTEAIACDPVWRGNVLRTGPIDLESVKALASRLGELGEFREVSDGIALRDIVGRRFNDKSALMSLFRAMASGDIRAYGFGGTDGSKRAGSMLFPKSEVVAIVGTATLNASMTLVQVEKATGWKYESLVHWADQGLMEAQTVPMRGQEARTVPAVSLLQFARTYVPVAELASALSTKPSALLPKLKALGLEVVGQKEIAAGASRGALVRRADVLRLLASTIDSTHLRGSR